MVRKKSSLTTSLAMAALLGEAKTASRVPAIPPSEWVRVLRDYLRMTQTELAQRAKMPQSHIAAIEAGNVDVQISTLRRLFQALSCDLAIQPQPFTPIREVLRGRARAVALKRLKRSMGTMALEGQAPGKEHFQELLEARTDDVLADKRGSLRADDEA